MVAPKLLREERVHGAPGEIRTPDLTLRRRSLYPAELRARSGFIIPRRLGLAVVPSCAAVFFVVSLVRGSLLAFPPIYAVFAKIMSNAHRFHLYELRDLFIRTRRIRWLQASL